MKSFIFPANIIDYKWRRVYKCFAYSLQGKSISTRISRKTPKTILAGLGYLSLSNN